MQVGSSVVASGVSHAVLEADGGAVAGAETNRRLGRGSRPRQARSTVRRCVPSALLDPLPPEHEPADLPTPAVRWGERSVSGEGLGNPQSGCQSRPSRLSAPNSKAAKGRPITTMATASQIMPTARIAARENSM